MPGGFPDPKQMGYYFAISQVALEMVVPVVLGVLLDRYLNWTPWGMIFGAVLGLFGGLMHLITLVSRHDGPGSARRGQDEQ